MNLSVRCSIYRHILAFGLQKGPVDKVGIWFLVEGPTLVIEFAHKHMDHLGIPIMCMTKE